MSDAIDTSQALYHLRSGSASKLGQRSEGQVHFELLTDQNNSELFIRLTANDGGGYFSRETIPFARVRTVVAEFADNQAFPSKVFAGAFIGRSQNNPGFLACICRAQGLIASVPGNAHLHQLAGDWSQWEKACLALPGVPLHIEAPIEPEPVPAKISKKATRANRKAIQVAVDSDPETHSDEVGDAHPA